MTATHDERPRVDDVRALARREGPVLSLFVPVTASVPEVAQNAVRHARVVSRGVARLREVGGDEGLAARAEAALAGFAEDAAAPAPGVASRAAFWSADAGLQVFGLPFSSDEAARVADRAFVRPVARAAQRPGRYRVLVLSANQVALYEGDERSLQRVDTRLLPESLAAALGGELTGPQLQLHSGGGSGDRPVYHGQGGAPRGRRVDLERFHRHVARGLEAEIGGDAVPLVLAADGRHGPGLRRALRRGVGLIAQPLEGNAEHLSPPALHAATWPLARDAADVRAGLREAREARCPPVTRLSEIASNAVMGRVRRLWVPALGEVPGRLAPAHGGAAEAWADDDLLESLAAEVLRRGGEVAVLEGERFPADREALAAELW